MKTQRLIPNNHLCLYQIKFKQLCLLKFLLNYYMVLYKNSLLQLLYKLKTKKDYHHLDLVLLDKQLKISSNR